MAISGRDLSWSVLAADALEITIYPSILYGLCRTVFPVINHTLVAFTLNKATQRGYIKSPEQHKSWAVWSAMAGMGVVAVVPTWCVALGVRLPGALDPTQATAEIKGELVQMFSRMDLGIAGQTVGACLLMKTAA
jgi:hypothetical protein